jgi:flagellar biosynthesis/type III secretory pathway M-ring protein FliF/YscJ
MDLTALFIIVASAVLAFIVARALGKRFRARRAAQQAQQQLAGQSRQVRRAQARKNRT